MKMTKRQKTAVGILLAIIVIVTSGLAFAQYSGAFAGVDGDGQQGELDGGSRTSLVVDAEKLPTIELRQVSSYSRKVFHTGTVQTRSHTMVAFQRNGLVTDLLVEEGNFVEEHHPLGVMDSRHLIAQQASLAAKLKQAQSIMEELQKGPRQESIDAASNVVDDLEQQFKAQSLRLKRSEELLRSNSIARQDYERELYAQRGLEARLKAARNRLDELNAGTRSEQIDAQESSITSIKAEQQVVQYNIDDCQLEAPFSGMIINRFVDPGTVVSAGTPVFELIDHRNLEIHVGVPQSFASQLQPGAVYKIRAGQNSVEGTLRVVLPRVESATRTCKAILDVVMSEGSASTTNPLLITGQLVKVELTQEIQETGFWIPRMALTADHSGLWSCLVVKGNSTSGVATKQSVEILHQRDGWVFVRGTLQDGHLLICDGVHRVVPGQQVTVQLVHLDNTSTDVSAVPSTRTGWD